MEIVLLMARLALALVFGAAGVGKAFDLTRSRRTMIDFGLPAAVAAPLGSGLPFIEILVALALLPLASVWWGAVAALALLLIFATGIGLALARGQAPDCNCFGQLHSKPVSWSLFARNLLLAAFAGLIVVRGKQGVSMSAFNWLADLKIGEVVNLAIGLIAAGLLAATLVFLRRVLKQQATVLERIDALKKVIDEDYAEPAPVEHQLAAPPAEGALVGAPAPSFTLAALDGGQVTLDDLLAEGNPVLLLFVSPNCAPCKTLLPAVSDWEHDYGDQLTIALISKGSLADNQKHVAKYGARYLLLQGARDVAEQYQARWTPTAVLISRSGKIASPAVIGDEAIKALVKHVIMTGAGPVISAGSDGFRAPIAKANSLFEPGEPAPSFSLPDLHGRMVHTDDLLGGDTLLVFWDPGCPFCRAMIEDIKAWEEQPPAGAPRLVIIASGNSADARTKGRDFKSLILLDPEFSVGQRFGSNSTPSAVLLDGDGRVASGVEAGKGNILTLAGVRNVELPVVPSF